MTDSRQLSRAEEQRIDDKIRRGIREYFKNGLPSGTYSTYQWDGTKIVGGGAGGLSIDAIYTMSTTNTVLGDGTPKRVNFNVQEYDPRSQVTTGASWAFTAALAGVYIVLVNAPLNIADSIDWVAADRADLSLQGDVNEVLATWVGIAIDARPSDLPLLGFRGVPLAAGDVIYAQVVQDCGTDRTIDESVANIVIAHV